MPAVDRLLQLLRAICIDKMIVRNSLPLFCVAADRGQRRPTVEANRRTRGVPTYVTIQWRIGRDSFRVTTHASDVFHLNVAMFS